MGGEAVDEWGSRQNTEQREKAFLSWTGSFGITLSHVGGSEEKTDLRRGQAGEAGAEFCRCLPRGITPYLHHRRRAYFMQST